MVLQCPYGQIEELGITAPGPGGVDSVRSCLTTGTLTNLGTPVQAQ